MNNAWNEIEKHFVEVMYCQTYAAFFCFFFLTKLFAKIALIKGYLNFH